MEQSVDLDEADPRSYIRLAARIRNQILSGELELGGRVPSITMLSQEHGHTRQTCAKALQLLVDDGLVFRVAGLSFHVSRSARKELLQE